MVLYHIPREQGSLIVQDQIRPNTSPCPSLNFLSIEITPLNFTHCTKALPLLDIQHSCLQPIAWQGHCSGSNVKFDLMHPFNIKAVFGAFMSVLANSCFTYLPHTLTMKKVVIFSIKYILHVIDFMHWYNHGQDILVATVYKCYTYMYSALNALITNSMFHLSKRGLKYVSFMLICPIIPIVLGTSLFITKGK